jgi:peptidyl-prolyl cis-trans isomerase C
MDDLREIKRREIEVDKLIEKTLPPFKEAHIQHIAVLVKWAGEPKLKHAKQYSESEARAIMANIVIGLKAGTTFQVLAKKYSEDPSTKDIVGDLGIVTEKDGYDPAFLKAVFSLKAGEMKPVPVRTSYGLELIRAVSTSDDHPASEDQLYAVAHEQVTEREVRAQLHDYIPGLIARSTVVDYLSK